MLFRTCYYISTKRFFFFFVINLYRRLCTQVSHSGGPRGLIRQAVVCGRLGAAGVGVAHLSGETVHPVADPPQPEP